jgi:mannose-6-phosphate isomerase
MTASLLYPLKFAPLYQYRLWGGRRLGDLLGATLPGDGPVGEAWVLSDRDDHPSRVANGPLEGQTIGQLLDRFREPIMGRLAPRFRRFPLLLKFLDAHAVLSVQVHPSDAHPDLLRAGETGKTEAWVVLEATAESRIYAGLKVGTTAEGLRTALASGAIAERLASFTPKAGDAFFIPAGTVHTLGAVVVFEVQQNSDVTFRLYDWDRADARTGRPRDLQVDQALACIDFSDAPAGPVTPAVVPATPGRERLFQCAHFSMWRDRGPWPRAVSAPEVPRVLVCVEGSGQIESGGVDHAVGRGDVWLLPAAVGVCTFWSTGGATLLELALPEGP